MAEPSVVRVASIPADHPYVRHLAAVQPPPGVRSPDGDPPPEAVQPPRGVRRLPDPTPRVPDPQPGQWWPPAMLEPAWIADHHGQFDLVHLHFGFDAVEPDRLRSWLAALARLGKPLVLTVHDLVNPHFANPSRHLEQLGVLIPAAAALITLTPGAATEITRRWSRQAQVIPHPHVVPLDRLAVPAAPHPGFVIGVHVKNRANLDPLPVLEVLLKSVSGRPDVTLRIDAHPGLLDPSRTTSEQTALRAWLIAHRGHPQLRLQLHDRFSDAELWDYLQALDLCVLPYRFGTHSGWLEACVDLGTAVLVPSIGYYREQHGHPTYPVPTDLSSGNELSEIVRAILAHPGAARPTPPDRACQRKHIAAEHEVIYRGVLRQR